MSQVYQNIGNIYSDKNQSALAVKNYHRSLALANKISDSITIAMASQSLGHEFLYLEKLDSSEFYS